MANAVIPVTGSLAAALKSQFGLITPPAGEIYLTQHGWHYVSVIKNPAGVTSLWIIYSSSVESRQDIAIARQVATASGATRLLVEVPANRIQFYTRLGFAQAPDYGYGVLELPVQTFSGSTGGAQ